MLLLTSPWQSLETVSAWSILMCLLTYFYIPALKSSAANLRAWARYFPIKYIFTSSFLSQFPFYGLVSVVQRNWLISQKLRWKKSFRRWSPKWSLNSVSLEITYTQGHARSLILTQPLLWEEHPVGSKKQTMLSKAAGSGAQEEVSISISIPCPWIVSFAPSQVIIHSTASHFQNTIQISRKGRLAGLLTAPIITPPHSHLSRLA